MIKSTQKAWLKPYIDMNTELRQKQKMPQKNIFFKLMKNAVFGKAMENVREHVFRTFNTIINLLSTNFTKWSNTLKQFVGNLPTNCLNVFDHFVGLALK